MDIKSSLAAQTYAAARPGTQPKLGMDGAGSAIESAAKGFTQTLSEGETTAKAALVGQADSLALVTALSESQLAVETAVTVRDKVVEAYQEILRMPV